MKMIIDDSEIELKEIKDITHDHGKVIVKHEDQGKRHEAIPEIVKEIAAYDSLAIGSSKSAEINGVPQSSASKYGDGKDISDEDTKARIMSTKYNIADTAITKLMETLDLFNPQDIEKPNDIIKAAGQLAGIVEKVSAKEREGGNQVHLHLYGPKQRALSSYEVIEVG
jgi:hypothetical protein